MKIIFPLISAMLLLTACGGEVTSRLASDNISSSSLSGGTSSVAGGNEPAARFIFHKSNFADLSDYVTNPQTNYKCLGDVIKTFYVTGPDYTGVPIPFPSDGTSDSLSPTTRPAFIRNVSVDMTNTYFPTVVPNALLTDACSYRGVGGASTASPCADFDASQAVIPSPTIAPTPTIAATPTATPTPVPTPTPSPSPTPYYETGFYRVRDDFCSGQGPILSSNVNTTRTYVGGVNIDLDRTKLGAAEDLLMQVTYQSFNASAQWPSVIANPNTASDETILEVNLIGTSLRLDLLLGAKQPRAWSDFANSSMPTYLKKIAELRDPVGSLRTEQVYIPLSDNALIDRIRVERVRGSYHLFQIDLYRLGNRSDE
jgi:hypothetical protein